jgi:hypothetical protein
VIGATPGPRTPDASPSYDLDELYGDYFSLHEGEASASSDPGPATVEGGHPLAHRTEALHADAAAPPMRAGAMVGQRRTGSATIVHVHQKLTDPTWLIPTRPAPAPPRRPRPLLLPTIIVTPPADEPQALGGIMAREVQRQLLLLSDEISAVGQQAGARLVRHLHTCNALGTTLALALRRLDRVARMHGGYGHVAGVLPAVRGVLTAHMAAVIDQSLALPAPQLLTAVQGVQAARRAPGLYLLVAGVPLSLPLALQALEDMETDCWHGPTLQELMLSYRAFKEQAARLPPGGDGRLRIHLPHKYYLPYATPGQMALAWGQRANALWTRCLGLARPHTRGASGAPTAGPTEVAHWRPNRAPP